MTAEEILRINLAERLFSASDQGKLKIEFNTLARAWHPDTCSHPLAGQVFGHVRRLYEDAAERMDLGTFGCLARFGFEFGDVQIHHDNVTYSFDRKHEPWHRAATLNISNLPFGSTEMRDSISQCIPIKPTSVNVVGSRPVLRISKGKDTLMLRDVIAHYPKGTLDPRHAAWMISSLLNVACYLSWAGVSHQAIDTKTFFVSPSKHVGMLLGGWEFSIRFGATVTSLPTRTHANLPFSVQRSKIASAHTDLELVRATARELTAGVKLPDPMADWLKGTTTGDAVKDYQQWGTVLKQSFGARRFTPMDLTPEALYPPRRT